MVKAQVFIYEKQFDGLPKYGDLKLVEEELPTVKDGEFLVEAIFLSVDPYMRKLASDVPLGKPFIGTQVAVVKESQHSKYPVGTHILAGFGWRSHTISDGSPEDRSNIGKAPLPITILPNFGDLSYSLALGILGGTGNTAFFGLLEILKPKLGQTLVVSGAGGAVGNIVGQIGKIKGCKVIGIAGSDEKGKWLTEELGFNAFINYKTQDVAKVLKEVAPNGVDLYFDNVGGELSSTVIHQINFYGRVACCGSVAEYNDRSIKGIMFTVDYTVDIVLSPIQFPMVYSELTMKGFQVSSFRDRFPQANKQILEWIQTGKLKIRETITEGFENMYDAFIDMLKGRNFGKAIIKV